MDGDRMPPRLVFERAIHIDPETGGHVTYWPERVTMKDLAANFIDGPAFFSASYMNHPGAVSGNILKRAWLLPYHPSELREARVEEKIPIGNKGPVFAGIDTTEGSESDTGDHCAMMAGERVGPRLYLTAYRAGRWDVETQAEKVNEWLDLVRPLLTKVEDTVSRGYVFAHLSHTVNNGRGTDHAFEIVKPPKNDSGAKQARFMSMGARFQGQRVLVPGVYDDEGHLHIDPLWQPFVEQWTSFPAGHDDLLDAAYWLVEAAFGTMRGALRSRPPADPYARDPSGLVCTNLAHVAGRAGLPIEQCERCFMNLSATKTAADSDRRRKYGGILGGGLGDGRGSQLDNVTPIGYPNDRRRTLTSQLRNGRYHG